MQPGEPRAESPLTGYVWYVIVLLTVVNLVNYMDRMALAVLAPLIKKELALTDTQLGLLVGFAFAVFYAICGIPLARWADRGTRRNIIALAVATWSVMTALWAPHTISGSCSWRALASEQGKRDRSHRAPRSFVITCRSSAARGSLE